MWNIRQLFERLKTSFGGRRAEAELEREISAHLQMIEEKFLGEGMNPAAARLAARRAFGNVEHTKELQRDARSFRWLTGWTLELRLGARMLVRYPGVTVAGGLAMAFAILAGACVFEAVKRATAPVLPLPNGEEIAGLTYWDRRENDRKQPTTHDFLSWREGLTTIKELGAFRLVERNLAAEGGVTEPVTVAEVTPGAFRMTRVPPLLGRTLVDWDGEPGAPAVVVIGYRLWQSRFGGECTVVGRTVRLGGLSATVAGVMPAGFAFPVDDQIWTPLRPVDLAREAGEGGVLKVFGRLAPGVTLGEAQSEAALVSARAAARFPERYTHLTVQVLPYANSILWLSPDFFVQAGIRSINAFAVLLLVVICGNVALLVLTRTATREREILLRTALGATGGRILTQLLLEALLLMAIALVAGLAGANAVLKAVAELLRDGPERWPFWLEAGLSPATVAYATGLTLLAAVIVGVVPGLEVIRQRKPEAGRLRQSSAGGGGLLMGKVWTGLIVTQIAATVLFTATAYLVHRQAAYLASVETVFPKANYLAARLEMELPDGTPGDTTSAVAERRRQSFRNLLTELERRLGEDRAVAGFTVGEQLPLMATPHHRSIEVRGVAQEGKALRAKVGASAVAPNLFTVFQMPVLAGRGFDPRDAAETAKTVVVNDVFVDRVLGGRNAIGQQIRYEAAPGSDRETAGKPGPWFEIVGVVRDLVPDSGAPLNLDNPARPRLYHCLETSKASAPLYLAVRAKGDPQEIVPVLRRTASEVSQGLQIHDILPLDHAASGDTRFWRGFANAFLTGSGIVLFLSLAGIYSVTSFTVSRRTREIGLRVALGAPALRVILQIFRRPLRHVAMGVTAGCLLLAVVTFLRSGSAAAVARQGIVLAGYGITVMAVCVLACAGPALRALRVDPVVALREEA